MFHPTVHTVSVLQNCMLNPQEYAVNDCRPRDRKKTKAEQKRKRKNSLPQHQTGKNILIFFNESGLSRENKPLPRTQRPLQRVICVHFQENNILINKQKQIAYNTKYNLLRVISSTLPSQQRPLNNILFEEAENVNVPKHKNCSRCKMFIPSSV